MIVSSNHRSPAVVTALLLALVTLDGSRGAEQPVSPLSERHELLKRDVGTWDTAMKVWPTPGAEPIASQGVETSTLLPGGLWLVTHFEGTMANTPCVGTGTWGYDPAEKRYVGTWVDSMTPHLTIIKGDYDPETKTMTHTSLGRDPASGNEYVRKSTLKYLDDGSRLVEAYATGPDGQTWKTMEVRYTRHDDSLRPK